MRRRQLFEFTDLPGLPQLFRGFVTEFLGATLEFSRPFAVKADLLVDALEATGDERVVDLCSGGAGPWRWLGPWLRTASNHTARVTLTDKFPDPDSVPADVPIAYWPEPVDASRVPAELKGMRTLFNGFHHFPPELAREILRDAVSSGQAVAVYEALQRTWLGLCVPLFSPIAVLLLSPFVAPFRWSRLFFTYLIPVAPLLITWDAVVSVLRCYTPEELLSMAKEVSDEGYVWSAGAYWKRGVPVTFLVGYPRT